MLIFVLVINGLIGLACLFAAWRLWKLKRQLAQAADTLISVEQKVHRVLYPAPRYISMGQSGTANLRQKLASLEPRLQQVQKLLALISFSQILWRRGFGFYPRLKSGKRSPKKR